MHRLAVATLFAVAFVARAQAPLRVEPLAEGCVLTVAPGCDSITFGQLTTGDCTLTSGQFADVIGFPVATGQEFALTIRPLAATFTHPLLALGPPPGDGTKTPAIVGGAFGALWFRATSTGEWRVTVSSADLSSHGGYALHLDCVADEAPGEPPGCIIQELACNQVGTWTLDASSCKFDDGRPYNQWALWGVAGDHLQMTMTATGFAPQFSIYNENKLLKTSTNDGTRGAIMTYTIPTTGWYWIVPTTRQTGVSGGSYQIDLSCSASGCLNPFFVASIDDMPVPDGGTTITAPISYYGGGNLIVELVDASNSGVLSTSSTTTIQAPAMTKATRAFLRASNECGSSNSNVFTLRPEGTKRRTMRH
ncbi:MAG TPA: hypothetical protein VGD79_03160 [Thermoanaerobaculia bacterium]|jgi:hypothetical protein